MTSLPYIGAPFAELVIRLLERRGATSMSLKMRLRQSLTALLDSRILIEDPLTPFRDLAPVSVRQPMSAPPVYEAIEQTIQEIQAEGFPINFGKLVGQLGTLLIATSADVDQQDRVRSWSETGLRGAFLMTDAGGSSLQHWRSHVKVEGDLHLLSIDKIWAMFAEEMKFCVVMVRTSAGLAPAAYLLGPEQCDALARASHGVPFAHGTVPLGRVSGSAEASATDLLRSGGPLGVSRFLCQARPRFVLGVAAHVQWLSSNGRLDDGHAELADLEELASVARAITSENVLTRHSIDEVLALKLAVNETLVSLVQHAALSRTDQRDLLGFSKMEGSSYHCFAEIYGRAKGARFG